ERARRSEFAELVADHLVSHQDRDKLVAVVDAKGQTDHLRQDRRTTGPRFDHAFLAAAGFLNLLQKALFYKRTFPYGTCHRFNSSYFLRRRIMFLSVFLFLRVL